MKSIITGLLALLLGYLVGSIPTGVIIGKTFFHRDPRLEGSKNSGGTNAGRLFGKRIGFLVIVLDMIKTTIPAIITFLIIKYSGLKEVVFEEGMFAIYLAYIGAAIGHCFPIYAGFKGGKCAASFAGFVFSTSWLSLTTGLVSFFVTLKAKKYVSLGSIIAALVSALVAWILFVLTLVVKDFNVNMFMIGNGSFVTAGLEYAITSTIFAIILVARHSANIVRLKQGTESKIKWMK